jgi:hypothetical protein
MKLSSLLVFVAVAVVDATVLRSQQAQVVWDGQLESTNVLPRIQDLPFSAEERAMFEEYIESFPQFR